jgi:hypothetical protein
MSLKKCLYCNEYIDTENDDFQKVGKKVVCVFCYEDYADEIDNSYDYENEEISGEEE